jgi:hypothetical protein
MFKIQTKYLIGAILLTSLCANVAAAAKEESFAEGIARTKQRMVYVNPQTGAYQVNPVTAAQKKMAARVDTIFKNHAIENPFRVTPIGALIIRLGAQQTNVVSVQKNGVTQQVTCGDGASASITSTQ